MKEISDKRLYISREREREREGGGERAWVRACLRVLLQYKALDTVLYKWPTWEQGWLRSVCASSQSDQALLFRISSEMDIHI